jgi:NADPH:quinone reductase-like Zn-dependent oxidoreductase
MIGVECTGVITRVGSSVKNVTMGDRVIVCHLGCFMTRLRLNSKLVIPIPDSMSSEEATTMINTFTTALYSIINLGQLAKGQVRYFMNWRLIKAIQKLINFQNI